MARVDLLGSVIVGCVVWSTCSQLGVAFIPLLNDPRVPVSIATITTLTDFLYCLVCSLFQKIDFIYLLPIF